MKQHLRHYWRPSSWLCTALITAAVYAASPLHHLPGGDSGELMAEACMNGIAHPPGYPLLLSLLQMAQWAVRKTENLQLLLLNQVDTEPLEQIPFVYIANVMNAGFAVGAAACVTHVVDLWAKREFPWEAITAGLVFATSKLTWEYAIGLEVFALNNLLVGALHVAVVRHFLQPSARNAYAGAFICGLGLTNQHTISESICSTYQCIYFTSGTLMALAAIITVLFEVPFIASVLLTKHLGLKEILGCTFWYELISMQYHESKLMANIADVTWLFFGVDGRFLAGVSVYFQTFSAAQTPTPGSWGDASTLSGLWKHVLRQEYGTFRLSPLQSAESEGLLTRLKLYFLDTSVEFSNVGIAFACVGGLYVTIRPLSASASTKATQPSSELLLRRYELSLFAAMACYLFVFHGLANIPLEGDPLARTVSIRFSMQPNTIVAIWLGIGLVSTTTWFMRHSRSKLIVQAFRFGLSSCLVDYQLTTGFRFVHHANWRHDMIRSYGDQILHSLPENALLLSYTDINWNTIRYLQLCEHQRPDVTHLSLQLMPFPWFPRQRGLYKTQKIKFPVIRSDVSTIRTSAGYAKYLQEFLLQNLPLYNERFFSDLHAVNDGDIGDNGAYHGVVLTPYGAVWQVHDARDAWNIYERWEQSSLHRHSNEAEISLGLNSHNFATGSWEFVALTISNDGAYQSGLFRLSHWLSQTKSIKRIEDLVAFVHGLHVTTQNLEKVVADAGIGEENGGDGGAITYPAYDVQKNAVVARMRFQTGLEVLASVIDEDSKSMRNIQQSNKLLIELMDQQMLSNVLKSRTTALEAVRGLLPEMQARSDPHFDAFLEFVDKHSRENNIVGDSQMPSSMGEKKPENLATKSKKRKKRRAKAKKTKRS